MSSSGGRGAEGLVIPLKAPEEARPVRRDAFLSVVCPIRNAAAFLRARVEALSALLEKHFTYYEIIVVDQASTDQTVRVVQELLSVHKNIQYCALSRGVSDSIAFTAGLERALGDFAVTLDLAVDPPECIPDMVALALSGTEIVYGLPSARVHGSTVYDLTARAFLKVVARFNGVNVPAAMSTYRVFSRSVLNYMLEALDHHRTLVLAPGLSGYAYDTFEYTRLPETRSGGARRIGFLPLARALDVIFSTSVRPLRLVTFFAVGMSVVSVAYAAYVVLTRLLMDNVANGWATLSLQVSVLFFFISIVLAVMCEYVLQILETTNRRPVYHVSRELHSSIMDYEQDLNVRDSQGRPVLSERAPVLDLPDRKPSYRP